MDEHTLQAVIVQTAMQNVLEQFGLLVRYMDLNWPDDVLKACEAIRQSLGALEIAIQPITESIENV